jgi:alginate O-acetyltransferase complex protein AlgI
MLFSSVDFAIFLPVVFLLYWFVFQRSLRLQNAFILFASALFYAWWDWRYLGLVFISAATDHLVAIGMERTSHTARRKLLLIISLTVNLGMLGFFKYYDFFIASFNDSFKLFGRDLGLSTLSIVLPVGISFYTFQTLSYTIDVYRRQIKASHDPVAFGAFILFFPQLVAGPIERASNLLPQFLAPRTFDEAKARDGLRQMLWGLFKKVVVADNCAVYVDAVWTDPSLHYGSALWVAVLLFTFQIYADFSGYSDIAIGSSRLLGFDLKRNFNFPFFSRDVGEFWRRWHISLNTWFRDYLYLPLGGSRGGKWMVARNVAIIFLVSGLWHGANWTFVAWGVANMLLFLPSILLGTHRKFTGPLAPGRIWPTYSEAFHIAATFSLIALTRVFFRSPSIEMAFNAFREMFSLSAFRPPPGTQLSHWGAMLGGAGVLLLVEWFQREQHHGLALERIPHRSVRWGAYGLLVGAMVLLAPNNGDAFIYFQF